MTYLFNAHLDQQHPSLEIKDAATGQVLLKWSKARVLQAME
ncbi:hypothetical protein [Magnetococcus sp. PR-3]